MPDFGSSDEELGKALYDLFRYFADDVAEFPHLQILAPERVVIHFDVNFVPHDPKHLSLRPIGQNHFLQTLLQIQKTVITIFNQLCLPHLLSVETEIG